MPCIPKSVKDDFGELLSLLSSSTLHAIGGCFDEVSAMRALDFATPDLSISFSGDRQKFVWAQLILRIVQKDNQVNVTGKWDSQTKAGFRRFQQSTNILEPSKEGRWTVKTTFALTQVALEWIFGTRIDNRLGRKSDALTELIKRFQRAYRLAVDGKVGPEARSAMMQILLGRWPSIRPDRHIRLGRLHPSKTGSSLPVQTTPGKIFTDASDPITVFEIENAERSVFQQNRGETEGEEIVLCDRPIGNAQPVVETWQIPFRWSCLLLIQFRHPKTGQPLFGSGSGFLIGPRHVVTAAHLILNLIQDEAQKKTALLFAEKIFVVPAFTWKPRLSVEHQQANQKRLIATKRPFGWVIVNRQGFAFPASYITQAGNLLVENSNFDYAVLDLGVPFGNKSIRFMHPNRGKLVKRQLGWWGKANTRSRTQAFQRATQLNDKHIEVSGYPACFGGKQVRAAGKISFDEQFTAGLKLGELAKATGPNEFVHNADTFGGHSGSPVWETRLVANRRQRRLIGIDVSSFEDGFPSVFGDFGIPQGGIAWVQDMVKDIQGFIRRF